MKLYNEDRKRAFLAYINDEIAANASNSSYTLRRYQHVFKKLAKFEENAGKDIAEFNANDIQPVYFSYLSDSTKQLLDVRIAIISRYLEWCRDNGYLTSAEYFKHPFARSSNKKSYSGIASSVIKDSSESMSDLHELSKMHERPILTDNFIFQTQEGLLKYINTVLQDDQYDMVKACVCLLYYGFAPTDIPEIKVADVDVANHTVCGRKIDLDPWFDLIHRATVSTGFHYFIETKNGSHIRYIDYSETPYLIKSRPIKNVTSDGPVSVNYVRKLRSKIEQALEDLPDDSVYKNIVFKPAWLKKQHDFHTLLQEESSSGGINAIINKLEENPAQYSITAEDYKLMRSKAKDL